MKGGGESITNLQDRGIPDGWQWSKLGTVTAPSKERTEPGDQPAAAYLGLEHIKAHTTLIVGKGAARDVSSTKSAFRAGDVLYGKLRPYLSKVCRPKFDGVCSTDILVFPRSKCLNSEYLMRFLTLPEVVAFANHNMSGVQLPRISFQKMAELDFPLPPLAEQERIVAKLEEVLARVNTARERLAKVPAILKRFRQSVLAAACSGRLTADWRAQHPSSDDDQFRRASEYDWREDALPLTWTWTFLGEIADMKLGKMLDKAKNTGIPCPYLRNINVRWYEFDLADILEMKVRDEDREKYSVQDGDVLVCEGGEPGRAAVWRNGRTGLLFQKAIHRIRMPDFVVPEWVVYNIKLDAHSPRLESLFTGTTIKHLTGKALAQYPFCLPPFAEQVELVRRVGSLLALADTVEMRVTQAARRASKLTQSTLARAFRGELVPTEAELARAEGRSYESGAELLERIRRSRLSQEGKKPARNEKPMAR